MESELVTQREHDPGPDQNDPAQDGERDPPQRALPLGIGRVQFVDEVAFLFARHPLRLFLFALLLAPRFGLIVGIVFDDLDCFHRAFDGHRRNRLIDEFELGFLGDGGGYGLDASRIPCI